MAGDLFYRLSVTSSGVAYDASDDLSSMTIEQREGTPDALVAHMADPYKVLSHALQEGMEVEAELGTDDDHATVFRGRIYKVSGSFPAEQTPTIQLSAYDPSMAMGLRARNRPWTDTSLSDIVRTIAADYFTQVDIDLLGDPRFTGNGIRQQEETDLAFLRRLAAAYGCILYVTVEGADCVFHFVAQYAAMKRTPTVTVYYGRSDVEDRLLQFDSAVDASQIELPRVLSGIDYDTGKATETDTAPLQDVGTTDDPFLSENLTALAAADPARAARLEALIGSAAATRTMLTTELGQTVREASATFISEDQQAVIAQNQFSTSLRGMRGSGGTDGIRRMTAQANILIGDVGGRFSGTWFLSQVRHSLDERGYRTEFECRR